MSIFQRLRALFPQRTARRKIQMEVMQRLLNHETVKAQLTCEKIQKASADIKRLVQDMEREF